MKKLFVILFLITSTICQATPINTQYSQKDYTGKTFTNRPASDFNNKTITGSCFYQPNSTDQVIEVNVFPANVTGVTLIACNVDNVKLPAGVTLVGTLNCHRKIVLIDGEDTEVAQ
jgi:hypothetical protein